MNHCTAKNKILLLACAGASNIGQLTLLAVQELVLEGRGEWVDGTPGKDFQDISKRTAAGQVFIVVDGCEQHCGRKRVQSINCAPEFHLSLADLGIDQNDCASILRQELQLVKDAIVAESTRLIQRPPMFLGGCGCR